MHPGKTLVESLSIGKPGQLIRLRVLHQAHNQDLSTRTENQPSALQQTASSMDQATQQNAALVEEMAAAASSLKSQADELVQTVAVFKIG